MTIEQLVSQWDPLMASLLPQTRPLDRAAIWGQTLQESNCNPAAVEQPGKSTGGIGLWQHTGPRRRGLEAFATAQGKPWQDTATQVRFTCQELLGDHAKVLAQVAKTSSVPAAAGTVMAYFEAPANWQEELQKPGSTSARLDIRIKGTERALAVINSMAAKPGAVAPSPPRGAPPMVDIPNAPQGAATAAQVDSVLQQAETMGNQALAKFVPGAAPIVLLIEHMVINPMLPALEKSLAAQINSNEAAKAVFNLVMLGLGFVAARFLPPGVTPPKVIIGPIPEGQSQPQI